MSLNSLIDADSSLLCFFILASVIFVCDGIWRSISLSCLTLCSYNRILEACSGNSPAPFYEQFTKKLITTSRYVQLRWVATGSGGVILICMPVWVYCWFGCYWIDHEWMSSMAIRLSFSYFYFYFIEFILFYILRSFLILRHDIADSLEKSYGSMTSMHCLIDWFEGMEWMEWCMFRIESNRDWRKLNSLCFSSAQRRRRSNSCSFRTKSKRSSASSTKYAWIERLKAIEFFPKFILILF